MTAPARHAIMQIAYVVEDLDSAVEHWARRLGVGPFFVRRHVVFREFLYRGRPSAPDLSLAFAFSGATQIELIQQHNQAASVFSHFRRRHGFGVQHLGALSENLSRDIEQLAARGISVVQRSCNERGFETVLLDTEAQPGTMLELIGASPPLLEGFARMRQAAAEWDGGDPYAS